MRLAQSSGGQVSRVGKRQALLLHSDMGVTGGAALRHGNVKNVVILMGVFCTRPYARYLMYMYTIMGWTVSPQTHILKSYSPSAPQCDYIWKWAFKDVIKLK